jgi:hypothetical protein
VKIRTVALVASLAVACSGGDRSSDPPREPPRQRRVIEPPAGTVRVLPPYAIRADGVGPYRLGEKLSDMGDQLPSGLRLPLFDIPGVVHRNSIPVESNTVLIGGEPAGSATTIAVLGRDVARTESGIHVGSTRAELLQAFGPVVDALDVARDPRIVIGSGFPSARMLFDGDRIGAIVVTSDAISTTRAPAASEQPCARPPRTDKRFGTCLTGAGELVEIDGDDVTVRSPETERTIASLRIANLVFAAPLRNPTEGRDELIAVTRTDEPTARTWSVVGYRFEGTKIVRAVEPTPVYVLTASTARWIGAELREVELYLELTSRPDSVEVGGLLTTRSEAPGAWRDVVVISPASVARRRGKSAGFEGSDAGAGDAATEASEPGSGAGRSKP